jgi:hypothetical protein
MDPWGSSLIKGPHCPSLIGHPGIRKAVLPAPSEAEQLAAKTHALTGWGAACTAVKKTLRHMGRSGLESVWVLFPCGILEGVGSQHRQLIAQMALRPQKKQRSHGR